MEPENKQPYMSAKNIIQLFIRIYMLKLSTNRKSRVGLDLE